jgi:hypothetical protein
MDRRHTIYVIALATAAWTVAIATTIYGGQHPVVILSVGAAGVSSCWLIARYTAERLKRELLAELDRDVRPHPRR